jgi:TIR domain
MSFFITKAQLRNYQSGFSLANEYVAPLQAKGTAYNSDQAEVTMFLSHSHKDRDLIEPAVAFLRSHGVKIYVDWMDEGMPEVISGETAKNLKERIQQQKKFLVLVTENSKDSRWVPWELGYADPTKGMDHIAAFPVADSGDFTHNEYLKIYPRVQFVSNIWWVWREDPLKLTELSVWLRQ